MNVNDLRQAIRDALASVDFPLTVDLYPPPNVIPPHAYCAIDTITPDTFGEGSALVAATVTFIVSQADKDSSWELVDTYLSDRTIFESLNNIDPYDVRVVRYDNVGSVITAGGIDFLGFTVTLEILV